MAEALQQRLDAAQAEAAASPAAAVSQLHALVTDPAAPNDVESIKVKEAALTALTDLLVKLADAPALATAGLAAGSGTSTRQKTHRGGQTRSRPWPASRRRRSTRTTSSAVPRPTAAACRSSSVTRTRRR